MASKNKNTIDFGLKSDIEGNLVRISNNNLNNSDNHLLISNLLTALKIYPGKNRLFPSFGYADDLLEIGASFKTKQEATTLIHELERKLSEHFNKEITITPEFSMLEDEVTLKIDVGELPGTIMTSIKNNRSGSKTIETKFIK